jgi:hypothetical protein
MGGGGDVSTATFAANYCCVTGALSEKRGPTCRDPKVVSSIEG